MQEESIRRKEDRIPIRRRAWANLPSGVLMPLEVSDLSYSGVGMIAAESVPRGLDFPIRIDMPTEIGSEIEARIEIQYSNYSAPLKNFRVGALIRDITPENADLLLQFIQGRREQLIRSEEAFRDLLPGGRPPPRKLVKPPPPAAAPTAGETSDPEPISPNDPTPPTKEQPAELCLASPPCANAKVVEPAGGGRKLTLCGAQKPCLRRLPLPPLSIRN